MTINHNVVRHLPKLISNHGRLPITLFRKFNTIRCQVLGTTRATTATQFVSLPSATTVRAGHPHQAIQSLFHNGLMVTHLSRHSQVSITTQASAFDLRLSSITILTSHIGSSSSTSVADTSQLRHLVVNSIYLCPCLKYLLTRRASMERSQPA